MVALHTAIAIGQPAQHHTQTEGVEAGGLRVVGDVPNAGGHGATRAVTRMATILPPSTTSVVASQATPDRPGQPCAGDRCQPPEPGYDGPEHAEHHQRRRQPSHAEECGSSAC